MDIDKVKIKHLLLSEYSSIDQSGKVSAVGIFDAVTIAEGKASVYQTFDVVGELVFPALEKDETNKMTVKIVGEGFSREETLQGGLKAGDRSLHFAARFDHVLFDRKGEYKVIIFFGGKEITERTPNTYFDVK